MPINPKTGKRFYTKEQLKIAIQASALEYARSKGYAIEPHSSRSFRMKEHDSMIFKKDGGWFWNSQTLKGRAIQFMMYYENKTFVDAVCELAGESQTQTKARIVYAPKETDLKEEKAPFELPEKAENYKRLYAYLLNSRSFDKDILDDLVKKQLIYESKTYHNAVFVSYDKDGNAKAAFSRGTLTTADAPYKRDVKGSDKSFSFRFFGNENNDTLKVFEASIDAVSEACIQKLYGKDYKQADRIALGGVADIGLLKVLEDYPNKYKNIELCLDNDDAGNQAADRIKKKLESNYNVTRNTSKTKDFNEDLQKLQAWQKLMQHRIETVYIYEKRNNILDVMRLTMEKNNKPARKPETSSADINKKFAEIANEKELIKSKSQQAKAAPQLGKPVELVAAQVAEL